MIELIQFPWSPYCIVQGRILEFSGAKFRVTNIPPGDRSLVWKLTRERYYKVPVIRAGRKVVFETDDNSQVIAKYLDHTLKLGLFPAEFDGIQTLIWPLIENDLESITFKLNDSYWREFVPKREALGYVRFKERRFGTGCLELWGRQRKSLLADLDAALEPFEQMLRGHAFLLDERPRFVDFDLYGILGNFLYSGHFSLPPRHKRLRRWYRKMARVKLSDVSNKQ